LVAQVAQATHGLTARLIQVVEAAEAGLLLLPLVELVVVELVVFRAPLEEMEQPTEVVVVVVVLALQLIPPAMEALVL
jgi:hypothetical protein